MGVVMGRGIGDGRELRSTGHVLPLDFSGGYMRIHFLIHLNNAILFFVASFYLCLFHNFFLKIKENKVKIKKCMSVTKPFIYMKPCLIVFPLSNRGKDISKKGKLWTR